MALARELEWRARILLDLEVVRMNFFDEREKEGMFFFKKMEEAFNSDFCA